MDKSIFICKNPFMPHRHSFLSTYITSKHCCIINKFYCFLSKLYHFTTTAATAKQEGYHRQDVAVIAWNQWKEDECCRGILLPRMLDWEIMGSR